MTATLPWIVRQIPNSDVTRHEGEVIASFHRSKAAAEKARRRLERDFYRLYPNGYGWRWDVALADGYDEADRYQDRPSPRRLWHKYGRIEHNDYKG